MQQQKPLSNVSYFTYQEYQPSRRYGPQYEPGGYAAVVQQRTNMTQREDALKFEQGRIKALQEERLHIQKKTFTKWINSFLQKARMEVEDLFVDLADGRRLLKLLEIISGERLPRPNSGRMRVHKIENVNKSLSFLHTKVRLESIGAEDIVDGNPRLILGLIWTIILRFQIQEIEIDVDEENESSEKKSAKDALLLWCQRKTSGYHGVHIHNFSDSWRSGLGFNALIHAHRPDLFRWSELPTTTPVETLNHAFEVAHKNLGIPKLLDAEDVDTTRPDEKSVMTYVASYYHTFARMKNEQKSGRRIANIIGQLMDVDSRKAEYSRLVTALLEWIRQKIEELDGRDLPNSLDGIQRLLLAFKQYRTVEKPPKYKERSEIEALYFDINTMNKSLVGEAWVPLEGELPQDLERAWQKLEQAEHAREIALRTELLRQQRLEQLNYKFNTKAVLRKGYLKEMIQVLSDPRYGSNLAQVDATVKKHEAISADILARTERFEDLSAMAAELVKENYHGSTAVSATEQGVAQRWRELLALLGRHREQLGRLAALMAALREAAALRHALTDMRTQFDSEEVGRHLVDVERLLQAHALQELQLGAVEESIRRLVRQGSSVEGPAQPTQQLQEQLAALEEDYDSLVAAAKDRKARLEDARNLFQFLEDHDEEEGWVTDKQRICRAEVAAKDLRGVLALKQKHTALMHEIRAREQVSERHRAKGHSLIDAKHPKSAEIERRLSSLSQQWDTLRELAAARDKQLADAAEAHQFYGDANEAESWMKEKRPLVLSSDCGRDAPSAGALLARHKALHEEIQSYKTELNTLDSCSKKLTSAGILTLQLPTEVDSNEAEEEEWVQETRLVPTEVWQEEPLEKLTHRTLTEERSVPQVKALYPFTGQGISIQKGEVMFLLSKTNPDWWSVRTADRTDGFVPANYVREIEPRIVPVQVRRPEKIKTIQRVKKTVLVKQVVNVKRSKPAVRRASRLVQPVIRQASVETRMQEIQGEYDDLVKQSIARREQLEDAIKLFSLFAECDDFEKWIKDKEKILKTNDSEDTVDTAKRKYEKFVTDLSAASKRLEHIDETVDELVKSKHREASRATSRRQQLRQQWERLLRLKQQKEKSLEGASSVELFGRTCDEALEWMSEKEQQLALNFAPAAADLRTVQALQRRHAALERELEPLREKVNTVDLLADDVKSQYPTEKANVESRQREIQQVWQRCQEQAAERRSRLESAVGHQIFGTSCAQLQDWLSKVHEQLSQEATAKDVATAEAQLKQHHELKDDLKAHEDEFKEVIGLGRQLLATNPSLSDVADKIKHLDADQKQVNKEWLAKEALLKQSVQLQSLNREADHLDAASGAHEAFLEYNHCGSSVDEVEALLKRHEEFEARLAAQDERLAGFTQHAQQLTAQRHCASEHIAARHAAVTSRRENIRAASAARRRALLASLAHQQFLAATDELQAWIEDKTRIAKDQSYRDLANLDRKLQKHEAFERELQANEKQLRNVESMGKSLEKSDAARGAEISSRLEKLDQAWKRLVAASRDKGSKLRQAQRQRNHKREVENAKDRLAELERSLTSEEVGSDLRSCRRLLNQHQALEQELSQWESRSASLAGVCEELVSDASFDAAALERESVALLSALDNLKDPAARRRDVLETSAQLHKFAAEVSGELDWISERQAASTGDINVQDLHAAQTAQKKHSKLRAELTGRKPIVQKIVAQGQALLKEGHPQKDKINELCKSLEDAYASITSAAEQRAAKLEAALKAQQFLHDALEVESWLNDKAAALASADVGRDSHRATQLLTRHKAVELELDTYAAIISEMGRVADAADGPEASQLQERHEALAASLAALQRLANARQKALVDSVCRHEYLAESAELEQWIQEQYAAASSEDYGQDYEHLLILRSKFDELRHRVESGAERFNQCEELAKKLLASESPYIADIEKRQEALGVPPLEDIIWTDEYLRESWQKLVEQIQARASRLHAAGDIHRFHRDVAELLARAADKRAQLEAPAPPRDLAAATALLRNHDTVENDLVAVEAQLQVLQEEGARLQKLYPGDNVQQIEIQLENMESAWEALRGAAAERREVLLQHLQLQQFLTQVRDLVSWSASLRGEMSGGAVRDATSAQAARAHHEALRAELDARDDSFRDVLQHGQELALTHPNAKEIEERCEALLAERGLLHGAWSARQVSLDQLIDLHCFLRDCRLLHQLCAHQEQALVTEISPTCSVEEVDNYLKKHEAFEKLLATQDEKLTTLNTHGDKLLQQNHVESQRIADELQEINQRRKKLHELTAKRRAQLSACRARAQFQRDAGDTRAWVADKLAKLDRDRADGEVTDLEDKIKKLQKHQAFTAELAANKARLQEVQALGEQLGADQDVRKQLQTLEADWKKLEEATEQRGRGLEEAQDILEFNQHLDKIEAWIRDKEMMVQAHELGRDYEHCEALIRKLDDLDSDMRVDDKHVKAVCALADKLLQQGPSQQSAMVSQRRDHLLTKWRALSGALQLYRQKLASALEIHAFNRDVEETAERIAIKAAAFNSAERGRDLQAAQELKRRHAARSTEAGAVSDKIQQLATRGRELAHKHPEHAKSIEESIERLSSDWDHLQELAAKQSKLLDEAIAHHKVDESLKELELWVTETVKRMDSSEAPETVADAEAALELHQERKAEIDSRQKGLATLQKEAEQNPEKKVKLEQISSSLENAWQERKQYLTQAHQLQLFKEQARQTEDWLAAKEAVLNNDDLGENIDAVEALIRKHLEFTKLVESQLERVEELKRLADSILEDSHYDTEYIVRRRDAIVARGKALKESCAHRLELLKQSKQLHQLMSDLSHEQQWIQLKMQIANDNSYRDLSNLQSKIQRQAGFESELAANKKRIDEVVNHGEALIGAKHYASKEIAKYIEDLENQWRELQSAAKLRHKRLQEAYQARVFLRGVDELTSWLDDVESQLLSEDHGKDLASVSALLKRHSRLEQQVGSKSELVTQLAENAAQLVHDQHFMSEEIQEKADVAVKRYRQLLEPMQIRRDNLEDAALMHRWDRDFDEEIKWLKEREPAILAQETGSTSAEAQALLKKHLALGTELLAREPTIKSVCSRASTLSRGGHFAGDAVEAKSRQLAATHRHLVDAHSHHTAVLQYVCDLMQLLSEISEAESWLLERRVILVSSDVGRDEESTVSLMRKLEAQQRELAAYDAVLNKLEKSRNTLAEKPQANADSRTEQVKKKLDDIKSLYEDMKLLSAKRQQRLEQSLKYFKFVQECEEVQEWIGSQMAVAASEDYGLDVEHVETLQQSFDNFLQQLHANEGRIEAVVEGGAVLLEENTPEADKVKQRIEDVKGLWEDLKELALARQEALAGARQVHEFDRRADETVSWVREKEAALEQGASPPHAQPQLHSRQRQLAALSADTAAIRAAAGERAAEADRLGSLYPDAKEHVMCKLEEVQSAVSQLEELAADAELQLQRAHQLQAYFPQCQELLAWVNEMTARVTAPELASDVAGAERLVARHQDLMTEIRAKDDAFEKFYNDGEKLIKEGHFMSSSIAEKMSTLRSRVATLLAAWQNRRTIYERHLDALVFKRDADTLENWINTRIPLVRDGKLGSSVSQVEELIRSHKGLEETIDAQKDKILAVKRITLIEQDFKAQQLEEQEARKLEAERAEQSRREMMKARELQRIAEIRSKEKETHELEDRVPDTLPSVKHSEDSKTPAQIAERLHRNDNNVKRAESMIVGLTPKRTPSFTTRRRTQSFRRHARPGMAELPPVEIQGFLERKQEAGCGGKRATVRSWRNYYCVLCGQLLCFFKDEQDFANSKAAAPPQAILNARCEPAGDYTKRPFVFRLACADGAEYLFACNNKPLLQEWVAKLQFHAALPPALQLTPYSETERPPSEIPGSSSSSAASSPSPTRRVRTQREILQEARAQRNTLTPDRGSTGERAASPASSRGDTPERNIESTVLPSLPPRQPPNQEEVLLRNSEHSSSWGRTRFSNGRDLNAEFLRSQREAYGNNSAVNTRPASVAGTGGSPALDQRPASRSSGESELSISSGVGKEKKDKKGVFGGLFSRKKRPQSHM